MYEVNQRAGYYPTLRLHNIADSVAAQDPILLHLDDRLRRLRDEPGESVALAKSSGMRLTYVLVFHSPNPLHFQMVAGSEVRGYHATSGAKAFLGRLGIDDLRKHLASADLTPLTARTETDISKILEDIRASDERGCFLNNGESVEGVTTVSARFSWQGSAFVVTAAGPTSRVLPRVDAIGGRLRALCQELGSQAGLRS